MMLFRRIILGYFLFSVTGYAGEVLPKYGPEATPLSKSHDYFLSHPAPKFWNMIPYYVAQRTGNTCGIASSVMVINAARSGTLLNANDPQATESDFIKKIKYLKIKTQISVLHMGLTLDQLAFLLREGLITYGVPSLVEVVRAENTTDAKAKLHEDLLTLEKDPQVFLIANFDQKVLTGDTQAGHIAPVAAYDSEKKRVLILDPDREWYEPYWTSEENFLKSMLTVDPQSKRNRGYLRIKTRVRQ